MSSIQWVFFYLFVFFHLKAESSLYTFFCCLYNIPTNPTPDIHLLIPFFSRSLYSFWLTIACKFVNFKEGLRKEFPGSCCPRNFLCLRSAGLSVKISERGPQADRPCFLSLLSSAQRLIPCGSWGLCALGSVGRLENIISFHLL